MNLKTKSKFFSFLKVVFFITVCFAVSFAVIFPLWAFASNAPRVYSAVVLALAAAFALWKIVFWAKKSGVKKTARIVLKCIAIIAGVALCFYFLLTFRRLFSLAAFVAAVVLFKTADLLREQK